MYATMSVCNTTSKHALVQDKINTDKGPLQWLRARVELLLVCNI